MKHLVWIFAFSMILTQYSCDNGENSQKKSTNSEKERNFQPANTKKNLVRASNFKGNSSVYVMALSGLNMRTEAKINSKRIGKIPYGVKVKVLQKNSSPKSYESESINGEWLHVQYKKKKAYIFSGFVSKHPAPKKFCGQIWTECFFQYLNKFPQRKNSISVETKETREVKNKALSFKVKKIQLENGWYSIYSFNNLKSYQLFLNGSSMSELFLIGKMMSAPFKNMNFNNAIENTNETKNANNLVKKTHIYDSETSQKSISVVLKDGFIIKIHGMYESDGDWMNLIVEDNKKGDFILEINNFPQ